MRLTQINVFPNSDKIFSSYFIIILKATYLIIAIVILLLCYDYTVNYYMLQTTAI